MLNRTVRVAAGQRAATAGWSKPESSIGAVARGREKS
jgi:hypothetical protein